MTDNPQPPAPELTEGRNAPRLAPALESYDTGGCSDRSPGPQKLGALEDRRDAGQPRCEAACSDPSGPKPGNGRPPRERSFQTLVAPVAQTRVGPPQGPATLLK